MHSKILINQKNYGVSYFFFHLIIFSYIINISLSITLQISKITFPYKLKPQLNNEKKRRELTEQNIYGSAFKLNYYYTNLILGEKMQKQGYILDTGSTITTSTCTPICTHCGEHIYPSFYLDNISKIISCSDPKCKQVSSKCHSYSNNCSFVISYSEGSSLHGVYINEIVRFGEEYKNQTGYNIPIGCTTDENHLFYTQDANGIMGLANDDHNFVHILYKSGVIKNDIFSLCFGQLGGVFNIGEINTKTHLENITYVPMLLDRGKYFGINIYSISVNNKTLQHYNQYAYNIFIDSGTTISYINDKIFEEILNIMKTECAQYSIVNACGKYEYHSDFGHCFYFKTIQELNLAVDNYWPTIHFNLGNYDYEWKPQYYVFNITTDKKSGACMGINKYSGNKITLGSSWIIGHDIIFDRKNKLLGIAEAQCGMDKNINLTNGLELIDNDIKKNYNQSFDINNDKKNINDNNNIKNSENNAYFDRYENIIIWEYIILATLSMIFFIIIVLILFFKYFKKNEMKKMNIENNNNNNKGEETKKKDMNYKKISTEIEIKEKDNQSVMVIEN